MIAAALRDYVRREHGQGAQTAAAAEAPDTTELQRRLCEDGVLSEVKPPIADLSPYRKRQAVPIQGEPLSQTVISERR